MQIPKGFGTQGIPGGNSQHVFLAGILYAADTQFSYEESEEVGRVLVKVHALDRGLRDGQAWGPGQPRSRNTKLVTLPT